MANALSSTPVDSQDEKTYLELIVEHVNGRVPLLAAGSMETPDDVAKGSFPSTYWSCANYQSRLG